MDLNEKYRLAIEALEKIARFGHVQDCVSSAPVHECACFKLSEIEIAQECLKTLDEV
jgi:hypothetical protein